MVRRLVDASAGWKKTILYLAPGKESFRKRLEQMYRYITRPDPSDERVQLNAAGPVELKLKTP